MNNLLQQYQALAENPHDDNMLHRIITPYQRVILDLLARLEIAERALNLIDVDDKNKKALDPASKIARETLIKINSEKPLESK